ncbi:MAG: DUF5320 domain-containing protein [Spirochaetales bacterium]|nr:DUF5320 domain-containing protein [Spirochaetales bacterium]
MPRGDRRGPNGMGAGRSQAHCSRMQPGPMTGRGAGFCSGSNTPGFANTGAVGGFGQGMGAGRGFGGGFHGAANGAGYGRGMGRSNGIGFQPAYAAPVYSKEAEKGYLESEVSFLKNQLKTLEDRLTNMQDDE